jgi:hypothetical protein
MARSSLGPFDAGANYRVVDGPSLGRIPPDETRSCLEREPACYLHPGADQHAPQSQVDFQDGRHLRHSLPRQPREVTAYASQESVEKNRLSYKTDSFKEFTCCAARRFDRSSFAWTQVHSARAVTSYSGSGVLSLPHLGAIAAPWQKPQLGVECVPYWRIFLMSSFSRLILTALACGTIVAASTTPLLAYDCGRYVSGCLSSNGSKPDAKAKCSAAGAACGKSGTFVGPYTGQSFRVDQRCPPGARRACY